MRGRLCTFAEMAQTKQLLTRFAGSYWIAGGWAVDLFLGRQTRAHDDIEAAIARDDQKLLWNLDGIEHIEFLEHGVARCWRGERLRPPIHELHCYLATGTVLEVLLNEFNGQEWLYRRDFRIKRTKDVFDAHAGRHLPIEVVMLFKSKPLREKDQSDFQHAVARMDEMQKAWLCSALVQTAPSHPWPDWL